MTRYDAARLGTDGYEVGKRRRLLDQLSHSGWTVAAITGAPGFGKSALVSIWLRTCGRPAAWVHAGAERLEPWARDLVRTAVDSGGIVVLSDVMADDPLLAELLEIAARGDRRARLVITARAPLGGAWTGARRRFVHIDEHALRLVAAAGAELAEAGAAPVVDRLRRRGLLQPHVSAAGGVQRSVRSHLEGQLRWHDPLRHRNLHWAAARHWQERHEFDRAHRHLVATGDPAAVSALVLEPALALVDAGDQHGLRRLLDSLPALDEVCEPALAFDLAAVWFIAGDRTASREWRDRAELLVGTRPSLALAARRHATLALLDLADGDFITSRRHVDAYADLAQRDRRAAPVGERFAGVATRVMLACGDVDEARRWLDRATTSASADDIVAGLEAWADALHGLTRRAIDRLTALAAAIDATPAATPHLAFEVYVSGAWVALRAGELRTAERLGEQALAAADGLRFDWHRCRAGEVAALTKLCTAGPDAALSLLHDTRLQLQHPCSPMAVQLTVTVATALQHSGRLDEAAAAMARADRRPWNRLRRASILLDGGDSMAARALLDGSDCWLLPASVEAELLLGVIDHDTPRLAAAVKAAAAAEIVSPLLLHGHGVDAALLRLPLERLHPQLAAQMRQRPASAICGIAGRPAPAAALTVREQSIIELLPSHLTYAQIAMRLHVSVNTVKGNLKTIYRKVGARSRAEAVDRARSAGLL